MSTARELEELRDLISSDSYAISFQTMGQYRSALLKATNKLLVSLALTDEQIADLTDAVRISIGNVRSLGPAGALDKVWPPYTEWLAQLEAAYSRAVPSSITRATDGDSNG